MTTLWKQNIFETELKIRITMMMIYHLPKCRIRYNKHPPLYFQDEITILQTMNPMIWFIAGSKEANRDGKHYHADGN